jgi:hypothetical protein
MQPTEVQVPLEVIEQSDADAIHWLADLDLEPEVCHCLPHGDELPCGQCERGDVLPMLEARS